MKNNIYTRDQGLSNVYIYPHAPTSPAIHNLEQQIVNKFVSICVFMIEGPGASYN